MNLKSNRIFILSLILLIAVPSFAWGPLGHQAAAQIAWEMLDARTKAKVSQLLKNQPMAEVSTWADKVRAENPEWKFTVWYHFEKAPDSVTYLNNLRSQDAETHKKGGLVEALYVAEDSLRAAKTTPLDKENALKFLIHFIADLHQPLHTGRVEDNGGNKIQVSWLGLDVTLHHVWDSLIIALAHDEILSDETYEDQTQIYANYLMTHFKNYKITPNTFSAYDLWMQESMVLRNEAYSKLHLSNEHYTARFADDIDLRVYLAGLRIAHTINRIVNENLSLPADPLMQLRQHIVDIVGKFTDFVKLRPVTI